MKITVAHSPDSDDAFMVYGLASGAIDPIRLMHQKLAQVKDKADAGQKP